MIPHLSLLDFSVSDNDGLYALMTFVAIGFAVVLIVVVMRQSRASDRHLHAATSAPEPSAPDATPAQE